MHKQHLVSVDIRGGTLLVAKAVYSPSEVTVIDTSLNHKGKKQKTEKKKTFIWHTGTPAKSPGLQNITQTLLFVDPRKFITQ